ncbi:hypothetical protein B0H13DRAFT_2313130 [Mycena leptocephala]|nr:hypothetical protein B0H13DRAFT_2313130 [Mycena leptocephala]
MPPSSHFTRAHTTLSASPPGTSTARRLHSCAGCFCADLNEVACRLARSPPTPDIARTDYSGMRALRIVDTGPAHPPSPSCSAGFSFFGGPESGFSRVLLRSRRTRGRWATCARVPRWIRVRMDVDESDTPRVPTTNTTTGVLELDTRLAHAVLARWISCLPVRAPASPPLHPHPRRVFISDVPSRAQIEAGSMTTPTPSSPAPLDPLCEYVPRAQGTGSGWVVRSAGG